MAAARAVLTEVLTPDAYAHFDRLGRRMADRARALLDAAGVPVTTRQYGAKGCLVFHDAPVRNYRDFLAIPGELSHAHWLVQHNRGVFLPPWGKSEQWTLSVQHTEADVDRFVTNVATLAAAFGELDALRSPDAVELND
jgi:glutamate-1-semialdehyde 2,1-aminomutase